VATPSPYEIVFGELLEGLHPRLRPYFEAIPEGSVGHGTGVFALVGTPRRWLWPALWLLGRQGILFPVWQQDVRFTVSNTPIVDENGSVAVAAERRFALSGGERTMVDAITAESQALIDHLGGRRRISARLEASVVDGGLRLRSTAVAVRVGARHLTVPRWISPIVLLSERFDERTGLQRVSVTLDAPLVGRLYEYRGEFSYEIVNAGSGL
jgi:hypothetical protein